MHRVPVPSLWRVLLMFAVLKAALAVAGFARTWRWIREHAERTSALDCAHSVAIARAEYAIALGAALYPGQAACLERSLLLYWWLRRAGVEVQFRMGVQMYPFLAHAWVEHDGRPINDLAEHVRLFRPIEGAAA